MSHQFSISYIFQAWKDIGKNNEEKSKNQEKNCKAKLKKLEQEMLKDKRGVEVVERTETSLLCRIKNYAASERHGSRKWCISYDKGHWNKYVNKKDERVQYFLWTPSVVYFGKYSTTFKLLGFTLEGKNKFFCCFDDLNQEVKFDMLTEFLKDNNIKLKIKRNKKRELEQMREEMEEYDEEDGYEESGY